MTPKRLLLENKIFIGRDTKYPSEWRISTIAHQTDDKF